MLFEELSRMTNMKKGIFQNILNYDENDDSIREFVFGLFLVILLIINYYSQFVDQRFKLFSWELASPGFTAGNIIRYIIVLIVAFVFWILLSQCKFKQIENKTIRNGICLTITAISFGYLYIVYKFEKVGLGGWGLEQLLRQRIRYKFYTYFCVIIAAFAVVLIIRKVKNSKSNYAFW